jgi:uncharacterized protein (DUF2237 family)
MQGPPTTPTEDDEASLLVEHALTGPNVSAGSCKAAMRTFPWKLTAEELKLELSHPLQDEDEDARETKRPRLEEPFRTSTDEATTENTSHATTVALPPHGADDDTGAENAAYTDAADHADPDPVTDMHLNARTTGERRGWTSEENATLVSAVTKTRKKKPGKKYRTNWAAVAALVPGRSYMQCRSRWHNTLVSNIDPTMASTGRWTADEDRKLRDAVREHGANNWEELSLLVPGRTRYQCRRRWHDYLVLDPTTARAGNWTADEDKKLKDGVKAHGGKNWKAIAALVLGRTTSQCSNRWQETLVSTLDPTTVLVGNWTTDEDSKLKDGVREHGGKNWGEIATLVPGRTRTQCRIRWHETLVYTIDPMTARAGKWTADEDKSLKDGVREHGGKNWKAIAEQIPGRTQKQCRNRWDNTLTSNIDPTTVRASKWIADKTGS